MSQRCTQIVKFRTTARIRKNEKIWAYKTPPNREFYDFFVQLHRSDRGILSSEETTETCEPQGFRVNFGQVLTNNGMLDCMLITFYSLMKK